MRQYLPIRLIRLRAADPFRGATCGRAVAPTVSIDRNKAAAGNDLGVELSGFTFSRCLEPAWNDEEPPTRIDGKIRPHDLWSGRQDSNLRPPGPKPGALPACATPRRRSG
jgi:hypothetical protein